MKKYLIALLVGCCAVWSSCSDENKVPDIRPVAQGEFTDERDGNTYGWIRIGDLEWMTSNLKYAEVAPYYECRYNLFDSEMKPVISHSLDFDFEADYENTAIFTPGKRRTLGVPKAGGCPPMKTGKNLKWNWACQKKKPVRKAGGANRWQPCFARGKTDWA